MNPKAARKPTGTGTVIAEKGAISLTNLFSKWWGLFLIGILLILLGFGMLMFNWLELVCCFLASGYTVIGIGFGFIALGFLMPNIPFPTTPLGKVIAAGICGIIAFLMIFIVPMGVS